MHQTIDLNSHINRGVMRGNPADFPVALEPIFHRALGQEQAVPDRRAVVRQDTGEAIAVVSNRYAVVPHTRILELIEQAIRPLDVGPVPRGVYVDRRGAQMRALFKFPALAKPFLSGDEICPCLQVKNTYDGTSRIAIHIGAFRFVCTNLAVGGGGVFAGGFMSIHAGEIRIEQAMEQLAAFLAKFDSIVELYRQWQNQSVWSGQIESVLKPILNGRFAKLREQLVGIAPTTVLACYNTLTDHATHHMRSARTAFALLEQVNASFQAAFPPEPALQTRVMA